MKKLFAFAVLVGLFLTAPAHACQPGAAFSGYAGSTCGNYSAAYTLAQPFVVQQQAYAAAAPCSCGASAAIDYGATAGYGAGFNAAGYGATGCGGAALLPAAVPYGGAGFNGFGYGALGYGGLGFNGLGYGAGFPFVRNRFFGGGLFPGFRGRFFPAVLPGVRRRF